MFSQYLTNTLMLFIVYNYVDSASVNQTGNAILISNYAQVTHSGNTQQARSNSESPTIWTKSLSQELEKLKNLTSKYSARSFDDSKDSINSYSTIDKSQLGDENNPSEDIGVVENIDRFEPKPFFRKPEKPSPNSAPTQFVFDTPVKPAPFRLSPSDSSGTISFTPPPGFKPQMDSYASALDSLNIPTFMDDKDKKPHLVDSYKPPASGNQPKVPPDFDGYVYPPNDKPHNDFHGYSYQKPETPTMTTNMPPMMTTMAPVAPEMDDHKLKFIPEYLEYDPNGHDHDHHDHHDHVVYHELHTMPPTMAPPPPPPPPPPIKEHATNKAYSYYYLGRKLWYIPLYFSLYFIVYIFALIVRSVLRHKVSFPNQHDWSSFKQSRQIRSLDRMDYVNEATQTIFDYIHKAIEKYS